jgi:hypothetical protein
MMINEQCIGYDMEESDSGIIKILSRQLPDGIKENTKILSQNGRPPG